MSVAVASLLGRLVADIVVCHALAALASIHGRVLVIISLRVACDNVPGMDQTGDIAKAA